MNPFVYSYPTKVYFGEKAAQQHLATELVKTGPNVGGAFFASCVAVRNKALSHGNQ